MDRRDFHKWTMASLSGIVAGCGKGSGKQPVMKPAASGQGAATSDPAAAGEVAFTEAEKLISDEPHVCRGLNACKGLGKGGDNACAGQGACASVADHACSTQNACKGQGGCGETPGMNACKGQGSCSVPLMEEVWPKARAAFEAAMKKSGKEVGAAPAKT